MAFCLQRSCSFVIGCFKPSLFSEDIEIHCNQQALIRLIQKKGYLRTAPLLDNGIRADLGGRS